MDSMKYLEELKASDCFSNNDEIFIVSSDFKRSGDKICISTKTGFVRSFPTDLIVEQAHLYILDKDNNIIPINPIAKESLE